MIRRIFTDIAAIYDRMNHVLSLGLDRRWRKLAVAEVKGCPERALDLACGTGDMAFALARRFPDAEILGVDLTPAMLDIARAKSKFPKIRFVEGDALNLSSSVYGSTFALCTCAFGFRNFPDRPKALKEVGNVLTPKGELLVLEFFKPRNFLLRLFTSIWLRILAAAFAPGRVSSYRYLRESMRGMVSEDEFVAMAKAEGLVLLRRRFFLPCCTWLHFRQITQSTRPPSIASINT